MKKNCPKCSNPIEIDLSPMTNNPVAIICGNCGQRIAVKKRGSADKEKTIKCPKCGFKQDRNFEECKRCGVIFRKLTLSPSPTLQKKQSKTKTERENSADELGEKNSENPKKAGKFTIAPDKLKNDIIQNLVNFVIDNLKTAFLISVIIFVLSFSIGLGKIPFLSVFSDEDEIVYSYDYSKKNNNPVMFSLSMGNLGSVCITNLDVHIDAIPYPVHQVFYTVQKLSGISDKEADAEINLEILCNDVSKEIPCPKLGVRNFNIGIYNHLYDLYMGTDKIFYYEDARKHIGPKILSDIFIYPCLKENDFSFNGKLIFKIKKIEPETMVRLGFLCYKKSGELDAQLLKDIKLDFHGDAKIVKGDPQATTAARLLKSFFENFL